MLLERAGNHVGNLAHGVIDVIINLGGLKVVLEGRIDKQAKSLWKDAAERVSDGLADISVAVLYAPHLLSAPSLARLREQLEHATFSGAVFSFGSGSLREEPFNSLTLDELADLLNTVFRLIVQNDVVRDQVQRVETMIEGIVDTAVKSDLFFASDIVQQRLKTALGIDADGKDNEEVD